MPASHDGNASCIALRPSTCDFDAGGGDRPWRSNLLGQEDREDLNSKATLPTAAADAATAVPAKPLATVAAAAAAVAMISVAVVSLMESPHCEAAASTQMAQVLTQNPTLAHE